MFNEEQSTVTVDLLQCSYFKYMWEEILESLNKNEKFS